MSIPSIESVKVALTPIQPLIEIIVRDAWMDWRASPHVAIWRCKRSRANYVWEQIVDRAHRAFAAVHVVRVLKGNETYQFLVEDRVLFRFKKADETGHSRNVPTQLALAYHEHEVDMFGLPQVQRVEVVYQLNRLETEIADILVVARDAGRVVWSYSLLDSHNRIVSLPMPSVEPDAPHRPLVKPKVGSEMTKKRATNDPAP